MSVVGFEDGDVCEFCVVVGWCGCEVNGLAYCEWRDVVGGAVVHNVREDAFFGDCDWYD